ncbi:response regulator [Flavihumibacter sp. R14]|nr:response regulator [Flavihumibacter soli]
MSAVKRNLQIGFGFSLLLLLISSVASYLSISALLSSTESVRNTNNLIRELENTISTIKDAETGQRGFLLTGREIFLEPYNGARNQTISNLNQIDRLTNGSPVQQKSHERLRTILISRLDHLQELIDQKKKGQTVTLPLLEEGKKQMDEARILVNQMKAYEEELLKERTVTMNRFAGFTPIVIVLAALLALLITLFFYFRVNRDFEEKSLMQRELESKDKEINDRIHIIQTLAEQISSGDYKLRINDTEKDGLGSLAVSLDKMATSLQHSFNQLHDKQWLQTGIAQLNQIMVEEKEMHTLSSEIIEFIANYSGSQVAALYMVEDNQYLKLLSGYAFSHKGERDRIELGQGLAGQAAVSGREMLLTDIAPGDLTVSFASGEVKPATIMAVPVLYNQQVLAVIELGSTKEFTALQVEYVSSIMHNVGIAINTAIIRRKQQELLEETQSQSEELQSQHSELENLNSELEMQTQKIQASEEELRVQQEELLQSNQELEEKTRMLEERNQLIVERNLDIQQKAEQLELSTKYKSEFLANMSHELRTPLNSILLLSRLMSESKELDTEQVEYANVIQNAGKGLLSLIDEILDLSKIEAGKMELEYSPLTLTGITEEMRGLFEPLARERGLELHMHVQPNAPGVIISDKMRLEQVLKNLLSNAIKFTKAGMVELNITQPENSAFVHFSVKDTGIGIAPDKQELIFEAFQQADGSTRRTFGGTGLGLSISRELAKLLGGEIRISSRPGEGSEFTLLIPPSQPATTVLTLTNPTSEMEMPPVIKAQPAENFTVDKIPAEIPDDRDEIRDGDRVILIIEDDTNFSRALMEFSRERGYKCVTAVRGDQGTLMAVKYKPLAILLDVQLPVKDGWQVMQELKSNPATRHIPVHIMSSMERKKESLLKGAVDFIEKPVALEQMAGIFSKLEHALSRHPKKVMIVEENPKHAKALSFFLANFKINSEISSTVSGGISLLQQEQIDCVILDMGLADKNAYKELERVKKTEGLENLPIIIFTGKNLSKPEENRIKHYADSIVVKTAHSYKRILDEVGLFLHIIEDSSETHKPKQNKMMKGLSEVLHNKTVLIADDDVRNIFSLTKALEQYHMNVISATDGKEALKQLEENPDVDVVLMDMMMPEMDGYESTTRIRENPRYKNLPILAVTAKAMMGDREKCIRAGASDYISKPVDADQLISLLRVWLYDNGM